ncbi:hypothetical protein KEH51_19430 [[Brevibacterium] frigoritolerans]|uniref:Glycosyl hydrolase family 13 catalytic domain-containing protein n=1 Tax=Peribacillus frigoritolerans TaxID=450367 RepID=A0A941FK15_9BACI|nr:hypothetical protein [Peribacillus frigoritolerans]
MLTPFIVHRKMIMDMMLIIHPLSIFGTNGLIRKIGERSEFIWISNHVEYGIQPASTEHEWFQKHWLEIKNIRILYFQNRKMESPLPIGFRNWGPAWEYVAEHDEYFLHLFDRTQTDLNWENPRVRQEIFQCSKLG